jgi:6,7-dimethyl-8-ribityllumazine synthase
LREISLHTQYAILVSDFNKDITSELLNGAHDELREALVPESAIAIYHAPGAIELPLLAQWCAKANKFDVIICLGAVIQGETDHYRYVCEQVSYGCQKVMLTYNIPIIFGVLTVKNEEQAQSRIGGTCGHKGREAAQAAIAMANLANQF